MSTAQDDIKLAAKIVVAIKELDAADIAKKEKQIIAGRLLVEAQKLHPTDKAFEKFLVIAGGVQIRRAKDLIAFALGRKSFDQHQADHAAAQQRLRDKQKAEKIEREKARAALPKPEPKPDASRDASPKPEPEPSALRNAQTSAANLRLFEGACRSFLPQLNDADLIKAHAFVTFDVWRSKSRKAA